ncbi:hypothetical protein C0W91_001124 [Escherichia coli]|nr:hypothetical protein [Escherichia coli]
MSKIDYQALREKAEKATYGCAYLDGAESATNARRKDNNNPRTRGDFFYVKRTKA